MRTKQLVILIATAALLGVAALVFNRTGASPGKPPAGVGERLLRDFPLNDVARIRVASAEGEAIVRRGETGWEVPARENYRANFDQISRLLRKVWETKIVQMVAAGPSAHGRLRLLAPGGGDGRKAEETGTLLEFFDEGGKLLASLILGKESPTGETDNPWMMGSAGRFVLDPRQPERVAVVAETFPEAQIRVRDWLDHDFFSAQKPRSVTVTKLDGAVLWKASRENDAAPFALEGVPAGREADPNKLSPLSTLLAYPRLEDVAGKNPAPETAGWDKGVRAMIETFDGFVYEITVGGEGADATRHLKLSVSASLPEKREAKEGESEDEKKRLDEEFAARMKTLREKLEKEKRFEGWVFLVPQTQVADLLKSAEEFLKPKEEPKPEGAAEGAKTGGEKTGGKDEVSAVTPPVSAPEGKKTGSKKK